MGALESITDFNTATASKISRLLPVSTAGLPHPVSCSNCHFINDLSNNYCTNCGFPIRPNKDNLALYHFRLSKRKDLLQSFNVRIAQARNALYFLGCCSLLGIFYLFSDWKIMVMKGFVMTFLGLIYIGLGKWSVQKPFTSLLIGLITMITFLAINTWAEFSSAFTTAVGIYLLLIQCTITWFLLRGVKAAFHADIMEEEFKL